MRICTLPRSPFPRVAGLLAMGVLLAGLTACQTDPTGVATDDDIPEPSAIIGGQLAGDAYANVGTFHVQPSAGPFVAPGDGWRRFCTVSLIAPQVALTAGHCIATFPDGDPVGAAFQSEVETFGLPTGFIGATPHVHPNFDPGPDGHPLFGTADNEFDVAVLILDQPVRNLRPARLPRPGDLALAAINEANDELVTVGFGISVFPPDFSGNVGKRQTTLMDIRELAGPKLLVEPTGDGALSCLGDSGSPYSHYSRAVDRASRSVNGPRFLKKVLAVFYSSGGPVPCQNLIQFGWRVDQPATLGWVAGFLD